MYLLRAVFCVKYSSSSKYFTPYTFLASLLGYFKFKQTTFKFASCFLSINCFVDTTLLTTPNKTVNTNLCVLLSSKVPVRPIRYLQSVSLVIIFVNDTALNR